MHRKSCPITYDNNGNLLSESNGKTYSYNALNQLVSFYDGEEYTTTYTYLSNGLRASKTSGNDNNHLHSDFAWDGDKLVYEYVRTQYIYPPLYNCVVYNYGNDLISQSNTETNEYILFTKNAHGDVADMLNAASTDLAVFAEKEFDAFGNGGTTLYSSMGYAGQYHDYETGFIYLRARYYNPAIGRFISEDPHWNVENMIYGDEPETDDENQPVKPNYSSIVQSSNLYPYCTNNPVRLVDPSGEFVEWGAIVIIAICSLMLTSCGGDNWAYEHGRPASPAIPAFPGWDATVPPGAGWEWRGNGEVGGAYGAWYNPNTGESLHADFNHSGNIDPHWDYIDPNGTQYRIFEDGRYEVK